MFNGIEQKIAHCVVDVLLPKNCPVVPNVARPCPNLINFTCVGLLNVQRFISRINITVFAMNK